MRRASPPPSRMRFPCGHVEPERATARRVRLGESAIWVRCARCNVIALVVGPAAARVWARRGPVRTRPTACP